MTEKKVAPDSAVIMHYTLHLMDGSVADSTLDANQPVQVNMGQGDISQTFENALLEMKIGDKKRIHLQAVDAYGEVDTRFIYTLPEEKFKDIPDLEIGSIVEFETPNGPMPGIVRRMDNGLIWVDFNHPLAGRELYFDVEIVDIL